MVEKKPCISDMHKLYNQKSYLYIFQWDQKKK
jgi:hypothetical protein